MTSPVERDPCVLFINGTWFKWDTDTDMDTDEMRKEGRGFD